MGRPCPAAEAGTVTLTTREVGKWPCWCRCPQDAGRDVSSVTMWSWVSGSGGRSCRQRSGSGGWRRARPTGMRDLRPGFGDAGGAAAPCRAEPGRPAAGRERPGRVSTPRSAAPGLIAVRQADDRWRCVWVGAAPGWAVITDIHMMSVWGVVGGMVVAESRPAWGRYTMRATEEATRPRGG